MSILNQIHAGGQDHHWPARTPRPRRKLRIKRTKDGFVWFSKKKRAMTKPVPKRKQAVKIRKVRLGQIKYFRKKAKRKARLTMEAGSVC